MSVTKYQVCSINDRQRAPKRVSLQWCLWSASSRMAGDHSLMSDITSDRAYCAADLHQSVHLSVMHSPSVHIPSPQRFTLSSTASRGYLYTHSSAVQLILTALRIECIRDLDIAIHIFHRQRGSLKRNVYTVHLSGFLLSYLIC